MRFIVIGITDNPQPWFPPEVMEIIRQGQVFSGGRRHHEIVMPLLPPDARWIDITAPLDKVFEEYRELQPPPQPLPCREGSSNIMPLINRSAGSPPYQGGAGGGSAIIVFASGDPLFFGFATTIQRRMPEAELVVFPTLNSLQMLAHRLTMPYHDMRIVSLTGRPWPDFDRALIERTPKIGILTDKEHTPSAIAQRMLEYGYRDYRMHVGEHLGHPGLERVVSLSLEEAAKEAFAMPNCIILDPPPALPCREGEVTSVDKEQGPSRLSSPSLQGRAGGGSPYGLSDASFALLDGRAKMITKMPIRLLTLQALDLPRRRTLWDIGACTGSVSIEARLLFPHLRIEAFEVRPECEAIIHENMRRHGAPGIGVHIGDFRLVSCDSVATDATGKQAGSPDEEGPYGRPDAVFIGGHGGHLRDIMEKVLRYLAPDGVIVMNSVAAPRVSRDSFRLWNEACAELHLRQDEPTRIQLNDNHPITILRCRR